jgi:hypothetical protein
MAGLDPTIHVFFQLHVSKDVDPSKLGFTRVSPPANRKSDISDLRVELGGDEV